jgi:hypothetical protein
MNFKKRLKCRTRGNFIEYPKGLTASKIKIKPYNRIRPTLNFTKKNFISKMPLQLNTTLKIHNGIQSNTFFEDIVLFTHIDGMQKLFYYNGFTFYFYSTNSSSFIMFSPKSFRQGKIFYNTHFNENKARKIYLESI